MDTARGLSRLTGGLVGLALLALSAPANAFAIYLDQTDWLNAVAASPLLGPVVFDSFDNPTAGNQDVVVFDSGVVSTGAPGSGIESNKIDDVGQRYFGNLRGGGANPDHFESIIWDFPMPIFAFAADWSVTGAGDGLTVTGDFDGLGQADLFWGVAEHTPDAERRRRGNDHQQRSDRQKLPAPGAHCGSR